MNVICYDFIAQYALFVKMLVFYIRMLFYRDVFIVKFLDSSSNIRLFFGIFQIVLPKLNL